MLFESLNFKSMAFLMLTLLSRFELFPPIHQPLPKSSPSITLTYLHRKLTNLSQAISHTTIPLSVKKFASICLIPILISLALSADAIKITSVSMAFLSHSNLLLLSMMKVKLNYSKTQKKTTGLHHISLSSLMNLTAMSTSTLSLQFGLTCTSTSISIRVLTTQTTELTLSVTMNPSILMKWWIIRMADIYLLVKLSGDYLVIMLLERILPSKHSLCIFLEKTITNSNVKVEHSLPLQTSFDIFTIHYIWTLTTFSTQSTTPTTFS